MINYCLHNHASKRLTNLVEQYFYLVFIFCLLFQHTVHKQILCCRGRDENPLKTSPILDQLSECSEMASSSPWQKWRDVASLVGEGSERGVYSIHLAQDSNTPGSFSLDWYLK